MTQQIQPQDVARFEGNYYVAVRVPRWANAEHTMIDCMVNFNHVNFETWTPFCADPTDYMPYSKQIFDECVAGKWGPVDDFIVPITEYSENRVATEPQPNVQGAQTL
jgi:hypothetical protein